MSVHLNSERESHARETLNQTFQIMISETKLDSSFPKGQFYLD